MPTGIEKRNGRYRAWVYDRATGKRITKTFDGERAAKQWRSDTISAIGSGALTADRGPTLREAVEQWLAGARAGHVRNKSGDPYKPAAIRGYEKDLRLRVLPDLGARRVGDITQRDLQALVDRLTAELKEDGTAKHSASTIQCTITPLRAVFRRAVTRGQAHVNPTRGLELPAVRSKSRRFCSPAEVERLLEALPAGDRAMWATAFYSGLRRGELIGLRWEDVDLASGVIRVQRGWDVVEGEIAPKSAQGRRKVPIPAALRDYLVEHRMTTGGDGRVFGATVRKVTARSVKTWKEAGLRWITPHDARHTYASLMIAAGVNPKALCTFMGHARISVTFDLYGHLLDGAESEAADLLDGFLARRAGAESADVKAPEESGIT